MDYEALPFTENGQKILTFEVEAISNDNERTGTATMRLQVTDFNDNAPEFERRVGAPIFFNSLPHNPDF